MQENPKVVLQIVPLIGFSADFRIAPTEIAQSKMKLQPLNNTAYSERFNFDGYLTHSSTNPTCMAYCQTFRSGVIETVNADMVVHRPNQLLIASKVFEQALITASEMYLDALRDMNVPPPIFVLLSLLGYKGYDMAASASYMRYESTPIDRDVLAIPEVLVEEYGTNPSEFMCPILDMVWNASGWPESPNFDEDGNWEP